jgi:hypothetical protein
MNHLGQFDVPRQLTGRHSVAQDFNPFIAPGENINSDSKIGAMGDSPFLDISEVNPNSILANATSPRPTATAYKPIMQPQTPQPRKRGRPRKHPLPEDTLGVNGPAAKRSARYTGLPASDNPPRFQAAVPGVRTWATINRGRGRPPKDRGTNDFGSPAPPTSIAGPSEEKGKGKGKSDEGATCNTCDAFKKMMKDVFFKHAVKEEGAWVIPMPVALELHRYFGKDTPAPQGALLIPSEKAEALADLLF